MKKLIKLTLPIVFLFFAFCSMGQSQNPFLEIDNHTDYTYLVEVQSYQGFNPGGISEFKNFSVPPQQITYIPNAYLAGNHGYYMEVIIMCPNSPVFNIALFQSQLCTNSNIPPTMSSPLYVDIQNNPLQQTPITWTEQYVNYEHTVNITIDP